MASHWPRGFVRHLTRHPGDLAVVAGSAWALRRRQWWRRRPFLPVPEASYWSFRVTTALGDENAQLDANDVVAAARWSRDERRRR